MWLGAKKGVGKERQTEFPFWMERSYWLGYAACTIGLIEILLYLSRTTVLFFILIHDLVILPKDLNFDRNRYIHALVYGRKPDFLGINVVDSVYCYYKTIITHRIEYVFLNLHPRNSYSQLQLSLIEGLRNLPSENLPYEDKQFKKVYLHIPSCSYLYRWPSWIQINHYWR